MAKVLLAVHVLAAILIVGPVAVAASLFPRAVTSGIDRGTGGAAGQHVETAGLLHRICRAYAAVGVVVPVFGIATSAQLGVLGDPWLLVSLLLTVAAAALLGARVLPAQRSLLGSAGERAPTAVAARVRALVMATGVFNLLWAVVVVLMIVRPGSTTGA
jgi:hypothetical protein